MIKDWSQSQSDFVQSGHELEGQQREISASCPHVKYIQRNQRERCRGKYFHQLSQRFLSRISLSKAQEKKNVAFIRLGTLLIESRFDRLAV